MLDCGCVIRNDDGAPLRMIGVMYIQTDSKRNERGLTAQIAERRDEIERMCFGSPADRRSRTILITKILITKQCRIVSTPVLHNGIPRSGKIERQGCICEQRSDR